MRVIVTYLFAFLFLGFNYAQEKNINPGNQRIETFSSAQGFYQNTVSAIVSDSKGYLWIATPNGLASYDGYTFEYYYHDQEDPHSLPNNYISSLLSDINGRLWIATQEGLCVYLTDKEQFIPISKSIKKSTFIKKDSQNRIWVGSGFDLSIYNSDAVNLDNVTSIAKINLEKDFDSNPIMDIEFLSESELLVATTSKVYKVNFDESYSVEVSELQFYLNEGEIEKIIKVNNSIWIGTNAGLYHTFYENDRLISLGIYFDSDKGGLNKKSEILSLYKDKENNLWIGTKNNGVLRYDTKKADFISFKHDSKYENGLSSNRINCFYEDSFGVLWIGTAQGGINKFDKNQKPFQNYSHNPYDDKSLSSNLITDLTEDADGRIWISFFGSTISRTKEKLNLETGNQVYFERLEKQLSKLSRQWVLRLYQDFKGYWWVSTNRGLYLYDEKNDKLKSVHLKVEGEVINPIFNRVIDQVNADQIMLAGSNIFILNNPWGNILNSSPIEIDERLFDLGKDNQVNDYLKDSFGNYWFVTTNGVFRVTYKEGKWFIKNHLTTNSVNDGLKLTYNRIFAIHISSNKDVWLGSFGGGLMKIKLNDLGEPEKVKSYHRKDGLRDEAIYGILEDDKGLLWMSTDMGIGRFNPLNEVFDFYDANNGILSNNFRQSAFLKTKNGTMLMGGVDGLTIFDPNEILKNEITPKILISRLKINNHPIVSGKAFNDKIILEKSISETKELVVDYNNRNLSLDIIVQHSATPNKNKLAYKLEGINKDWIEIEGGKTTATYTNLSPGIYNFQYKGTNGDGVWTENTENFTIQVLAPWYARWWSITLWVLLALALIFGVFKYLVRLEKLNQRLKFEQLDKERTYAMNQAKLRFFTNISHDFKTPLSLIIGPLEKIAEANKENGNQKYFSLIQSNIKRLQRLIDQLISYRKAETGHLKLNYSKTTLGNFIYPLTEAFEDYSQRALLNFYYKVDDPNKIISIDIDKTERILLNLFSNAVKYTNAHNEVSIEAGFLYIKNEESLFIQISNTGIGIPANKIDRIFDRFYRGVDDKNDWQGTGIGLALCKSLVDLMQGTISVTCDQDNKTVFKITLPLIDKGAFVEEDELNSYKKIVTDWFPSELEIIQDESLDVSLPTLLVVDDEQDVRSFLQEAFSPYYNVILAVDGEDGWAKLNKNHPQLVISDVMMPKIDGYELCKKIKSSTEFCHIPIILLTANNENIKKIEGLELGADDYIIKPFSIKYLEVKVKKLIERKKPVFEYFSRNSFMPKDSLINSSRDKEFLEKINVSIEKNMSNSSFGVEELATDINMSTSHFYRRLKELTGQAPNAYLRNFRLQKAAELLIADKNLTAADVMFEIGIESKSYYSSAFKKIHGLSPSEFIKQK